MSFSFSLSIIVPYEQATKISAYCSLNMAVSKLTVIIWAVYYRLHVHVQYTRRHSCYHKRGNFSRFFGCWPPPHQAAGFSGVGPHLIKKQ